MSDPDRIRIVVLGGSAVGKTSIIRRFLFNTFIEKYKSTVEDMFCKDIDLGHTTIKVDLFDTCGDFQFPAMRRLSIATGHAFLLVYSVTSMDSFITMKKCLAEIQQQRTDYQDIPMVVVGNKVDLKDQKQVNFGDVSDWLFCEMPRMRIKLFECSAKENIQVKETFRQFIHLSRILLTTQDESSLKRRSSAYVSATSKNSRNSSAGSGSTLTVSHGDSEPGTSDGLRPKPRSRSLIRRCSRKTKQQVRESGDSDDCKIS